MADADKAEAKKRRRYPLVLVAIPGWPTQDPGRRMVYSIRPTPQKAARMAKRLRKQLPEFVWTTDNLLADEIRGIRNAPFVVKDGLFTPVKVQLARTRWMITPVEPEVK